MRILQRIWLQMCTLQDILKFVSTHNMKRFVSKNKSVYVRESVIFTKNLLVSLTNNQAYHRLYIYQIIQDTELFLYKIQIWITLYDNDQDYTSSWFLLWPVLKLYEWRLDRTGVGSFYRWRTFTAIKICKQGPLRMLMRWKGHLYLPFSLQFGMSIYCHLTYIIFHALHCN